MDERFFYILILKSVLLISNFKSVKLESKCKFPLHNNIQKELNFLSNLGEEILSVTDDSKVFLYNVGLCTSPSKNVSKLDNVAVLQTNLQTHQTYVIGRLNDTDIKIGNNWGFLRYGSGDRYMSHCGNAQKEVAIMITCNKDLSKPILRIIEENTNKSSECYYLFELEHPKACKVMEVSSMGAGAITTIIIISLIAVYLCGGMAIKKTCLNSEGIEIIPNISFWRRCGTIFANCADTVCRPRNGSIRYQTYRPSPSSDNNLTINDLEPGGDDDDLLVLP